MYLNEGSDSPSSPDYQNDGDLKSRLRCFFIPDSRLSSPLASNDTLSSLAAISALSWQAISVSSASVKTPSLWNADIFDLALNRWFHAHGTNAGTSTMLLFHTNVIVMHTNMTHVQSLARKHLENRGSSTDITEGSIRPWKDVSDSRLTEWHAKKVIQRVKELVRDKQRARYDRGFAHQEVGNNPAEAPHVAICTYHAHLVLWAMMTWEMSSKHQSTVNILDGGVALLSSCNVRVAEILRNVLRSLSDAAEKVEG